MADSEPPKILGMEMQCIGNSAWRLAIGDFDARIEKMMLDTSEDDSWGGALFGRIVAWRLPLADCIAAIERELLSIRAAIPSPLDEQVEDLQRRLLSIAEAGPEAEQKGAKP